MQENLNELSGGRGGQTIFGESVSWVGQCSARPPRSKGLFSRAIIESGPHARTGLPNLKRVGDAKLVSSNLGCAEDDAFCLRSQNASAVLHAGKSVKHPVKVLPGSCHRWSRAFGFNNKHAAEGAFTRRPCPHRL